MVSRQWEDAWFGDTLTKCPGVDVGSGRDRGRQVAEMDGMLTKGPGAAVPVETEKDKPLVLW